MQISSIIMNMQIIAKINNEQLSRITWKNTASNFNIGK